MHTYDVNIGPYQWKDLITGLEFGVNIGAYLGSLPVNITSQSSSISVLAGTPVSLFVVAIGSLTITYQWYCNGAMIVGATSSTYSFYASSSKTYTCVVNNGFSSDTSSPIVVSVIDNPYRYNLFEVPSDLDRESP